MGRLADVVRSLVALGLLAGVGFALGAAAGLLWEEPRLVFAYFTGDTTEIAWAPVDGRDAGGVAVVPRAVPAPEATLAPDTPAPASAARPVSEPPPVAAAPPPAPREVPPTGVAVQVGAFGDSASAERLAKRLRAKGYDVYVTPGTATGAARWRVRVGPLASREAADALATRLKREEKLPTWVLEEGAS